MLNQNQTNTTTTPAAYLPAVTATRTARIEAAHSRHNVSTAGTWTATPQGIRPPIHRQCAEQLHTTADTAARLAIRARHQAAALDLFRQLTNSRHSDRQHTALPATATAAIEAERERDTLRKQAAQYRAIAERKTATPAEARAARAKAQKATEAADRAAQRADSLNKIIHEATASDRADIVQAAISAALEYDHSGNPDGAFAAMCKAAGQAITAVASPNALTATRTKVTEISDEAAAELLRIYPNIVTIDTATGYEVETPCRIPHNVKGATSQCYDTIEQRERGRKPHRRLVWCRVSHYLTVAPYVSYEAFTEQSGGDTAEIATNGGINAIGTQEDQAAITDLLERANLTERASLLVYKVADQTAARHGQAAVDEYWSKRTAEIAALPTAKARREAYNDAQKTADRERIAAQWDSAFDRIGVYSQNNRYTIKSRIYKALTAATAPAEPLTEAEQAEAERRRWESMQRNKHRGTAAKTPHKLRNPYAIIESQTITAEDGAKRIVWRAAHPAEHKPVIRWTESGNEPQTLTPAEVEAMTARERAAQADHLSAHGADIARLEYRRQFTAYRRSPAAYAAHDAQAAARVFWDAMTPAEQTAHIEAERARRAAKAAALAKIAAEAKTAAEAHATNWKSRPAVVITAAIWNGWTPAQRAAHLERTAAEGKRTEFARA